MSQIDADEKYEMAIEANEASRTLNRLSRQIDPGEPGGVSPRIFEPGKRGGRQAIWKPRDFIFRGLLTPFIKRSPGAYAARLAWVGWSATSGTHRVVNPHEYECNLLSVGEPYPPPSKNHLAKLLYAIYGNASARRDRRIRRNRNGLHQIKARVRQMPYGHGGC